MVKKEEINELVMELWSNVIGIDTPHNHDEIVKFIYNDVNETADHENWHSGDVAIAFRRWIENQSKHQP